jgi:hypothetical protein
VPHRSKELSGFDLALFSKPKSNLKDLVALYWLCFWLCFLVKSLIVRHLLGLFGLLAFFSASYRDLALPAPALGQAW